MSTLLPILLASLAAAPAFLLRFSGLTLPVELATLGFGLGVVGAAFAMLWAAEAAERDVPRALALSAVAMLLCPLPVGTATADRWAASRPVLFQQAGSSTTRPLAAWWRLRCRTCGGNTAASELLVRSSPREPPTGS